jgi:hypothetical protein
MSRRILSLMGVGSRLDTAGLRCVECCRCRSVVGIDPQTSLRAPVECCVCGLVFYPADCEQIEADHV